jgi:DNA adenine methylase
MTPTRPALRWMGGKWKLAPWIIGHFPPHKSYIEAFGGGANVLLRKPPSFSELYNDLDGEVVNLFRVLRDASAAGRLIEQLYLTPYARAELDLAAELVDEPVERARRLLVRAFLGYGVRAHSLRRNAFKTSDGGNHRSPNWARFPDALKDVVDRLRAVVIEQRPALEVIEMHDGPDVLFYLDPPYTPETRSSGERYAYEMSLEAHEELLTRLLRVEGCVVLSGYPNALYERVLAGWRRTEILSNAFNANEPRVEVLWMNFDPPETARLQADMFAVAVS